MGGRVIWRRRAEEDLVEAYLFVGRDCPRTAERLVDAVKEAVAFLLTNREAGRRREFRSPRASGVRSWSVRGFPRFLIFHRVAADTLEIVRIIHGARDIPRLFEEEGQ